VIRIAPLTGEEAGILEQHYRKAGTPLVRERAHAILLNHEGRSAPEIASILRRAENTIREWLHAFEVTRLSSIFPKYAGNTNASKLTDEQRDEIKRILGESPSERGLPKEFWTVRTLKTYLEASFGIVYESDRSYHYLLQLSNLSWKLPSMFDIRRDDALVEQRMKEIRRKIRPLLKDDRWEVLVSDESRIVWESEMRRAWLKRGEKTVLKVHRSRDYQNFIGMLNLKNGRPHLYPLPWQNQETVIEGLQKLKVEYPGKRLCLIWDNAKFHKGKMIRSELSREGALENFHLINFPPYAPDTNPQEHIWKDAKESIANTTTDSFDETIALFTKTLLGRTYTYKV
jgi:transposase